MGVLLTHDTLLNSSCFATSVTLPGGRIAGERLGYLLRPGII